MTITNGYATLDEFRAWSGGEHIAETGNSQREQAIEAASRWVDSYCRRTFYQQTAQARIVPRFDAACVEFGSFGDLVSVDTIKCDDDGDETFERTVSGYVLLPRNVNAAPEQIPYTGFETTTAEPALSDLVEVTGTWGWPAVPVGVKHATLMTAARVFLRKDSPVGVLPFAEFAARVPISDPDVLRLLAPYRVGGGVGLA